MLEYNEETRVHYIDGIKVPSVSQLLPREEIWVDDETYEAARLDHRFERALSNVSATYTLQTDGSLRVVNRGYDADRKHWKEAVGRAEFIGAPDLGSLQVSFFGPFYGGYHVVELDPDYRWAIVAGPSRDYLWLLTRTQHAPTELVDRMIESAARLGFPTERLIRVEHRPVDAPAL